MYQTFGLGIWYDPRTWGKGSTETPPEEEISEEEIPDEDVPEEESEGEGEKKELGKGEKVFKAVQLPKLMLQEKGTPFAIQIGGIKFPLIAILGILVVAGVLFTRRD